MGYSIATVCKSLKAQKGMLAFLGERWRQIDAIYPDVKAGYIDGPKKDLAYCHRKWQIGFDYNAHGVERTYAFAMCRWIALRVGDKKATLTDPDGKATELPEPYPYIIYDGDEEWPVFEKAPPRRKALKLYEVDAYGMKRVAHISDVPWELMHIILEQHKDTDPEALLAEVQPELRKVLLPMSAELRRLDELFQGTS